MSDYRKLMVVGGELVTFFSSVAFDKLIVHAWGSNLPPMLTKAILNKFSRSHTQKQHGNRIGAPGRRTAPVGEGNGREVKWPKFITHT